MERGPSFHQSTRGTMKLTSTQLEYLKAADLLKRAEARDFTALLTGESKRWGRTERVLRQLVSKGSLTAIRHGRKLVYSLPSKRSEYPSRSTKPRHRQKIWKAGMTSPSTFPRAATTSTSFPKRCSPLVLTSRATCPPS